jgi:membrane-bound lytic murein transglycosylase D
VELPDYISVEALAKAFKVDMGALRVLNPALRPPIWSGSRLVPRGYSLRLPGTPPPSEIAAGWARLPLTQRYVAQRNDGSHRFRRGETVAGVAAASGVSVGRLLAANGWNSTHTPSRGDLLRIPAPASRAEIAGGAPIIAAATGVAAVPAPSSGTPEPAALPAPLAQAVPPPGAVPPAAAPEKVARPPKEPVSARQTESNALLPVASPTGNSDTTDYGVGPGDTVIVQATETLGHFADWTAVDSQALRALNRLHKNAMVTQGRRIKLDLSRVSAADFVVARREYHRRLQETFFAGHRIAGTETYAVKRGDSLWTIAHQHADLPLWLVAQYNPDVNFNDMRPGTAITLPQVVGINRQ